MKRQVWLSLPLDEEADHVTRDLRGRIYDGDSYIVELFTGEQVWAAFSRAGGFELCDDAGEPTDSQRNPLDNVARVMVGGYEAGFGPSCPKAGAAPEIHLVVIQPPQLELAMRKAEQLLGPQRFSVAS